MHARAGGQCVACLKLRRLLLTPLLVLQQPCCRRPPAADNPPAPPSSTAGWLHPLSNDAATALAPWREACCCCCRCVRPHQNLSSSAGPVGKWARFSPIEAMNRPNRLLPPKALTGMLEGTVHLHATAVATARAEGEGGVAPWWKTHSGASRKQVGGEAQLIRRHTALTSMR